jgi:positive regulator of sigma E activity
MIEKGKITKLLDNNRAEVLLYGNSCEGCKSCITAADSCQERRVVADNNLGKDPGAEVEVELPGQIVLKGFFLIFILPIITMLFSMGIFELLNVNTELNLLLSFGVFLSTYYFANRYDKELAQKQLYKIIK